MTTAKSAGNNVRREDLYGRPVKAQTYEILVETHERIKSITKEFKVTAPELLEVLMNNTDWNALAPDLHAVRAKKEAMREAAKQGKTKTKAANPEADALAAKIKNLTPEKLAQLQALLG